MRKITTILLIALIIFCKMSFSQSLNSIIGEESKFYANTKQMNQFFRRFNGEENMQGKRLYENDLGYRDNKLRRNYFSLLFDSKNAALSDELKLKFVDEVTNSKVPVFLDFHRGEWFAEVNTSFFYQNVEKDVILFLKLEKENLGYKWVINNVYFIDYQPFFTNFKDDKNHFLHPLSHEIDFMNLVRIFKEKGNVEKYTNKEYHPDYLTLFLYEFKKGLFSFKSIKNVRFHFFQAPNWYFEVEEFNRNDNNSGWLISKLMKINELEKEALLKYIYHEKK